jgi:septum formation protein
MNLPIILASSSPYRKQILERSGIAFESCSPDIDETPQIDESASVLVERLSRQKAQVLADQFPDALIIGSDQVAECNGEIFGKPADREAAIRQLTLASGNVVTLHTGLALLNSKTGIIQSTVDTYEVLSRELSNERICRYIDSEKPYDCCGSLKVEGSGICLLKNLSGTDPNTLMGLPLLRLIDMLENEGVSLPV